MRVPSGSEIETKCSAGFWWKSRLLKQSWSSFDWCCCSWEVPGTMVSWGIVPNWRGLEGSKGVQRVQLNDYRLRGAIIFLVLYNDYKGLILTTYEPSEPNMGLWTPKETWTTQWDSEPPRQSELFRMDNKSFATTGPLKTAIWSFSESLNNISIILGPIRIPKNPSAQFKTYWEPLRSDNKIV